MDKKSTTNERKFYTKEEKSLKRLDSFTQKNRQPSEKLKRKRKQSSERKQSISLQNSWKKAGNNKDKLKIVKNDKTKTIQSETVFPSWEKLSV